MPTATVYNWIYRGWITARHAPGTRNWIITADVLRFPVGVIYPCPVMPEASARICGLAWSGGIYVANCSA